MKLEVEIYLYSCEKVFGKPDRKTVSCSYTIPRLHLVVSNGHLKRRTQFWTA